MHRHNERHLLVVICLLSGYLYFPFHAVECRHIILLPVLIDLDYQDEFLHEGRLQLEPYGCQNVILIYLLSDRNVSFQLLKVTTGQSISLHEI